MITNAILIAVARLACIFGIFLGVLIYAALDGHFQPLIDQLEDTDEFITPTENLKKQQS